jgi:transcriptional regulator with PAS, ATPase and Fis domain
MQDSWWNEIDAAVTVTDARGVIQWMNEASEEQFSDDGGRELLGTSVFDCHPEPSLTMVRDLYKTRRSNHYVVRKGERLSAVHQIPRFDGETFQGFVEIVCPLPGQLYEVERG